MERHPPSPLPPVGPVGRQQQQQQHVAKDAPAPGAAAPAISNPALRRITFKSSLADAHSYTPKRTRDQDYFTDRDVSNRVRGRPARFALRRSSSSRASPVRNCPSPGRGIRDSYDLLMHRLLSEESSVSEV